MPSRLPWEKYAHVSRAPSLSPSNFNTLVHSESSNRLDGRNVWLVYEYRTSPYK